MLASSRITRITFCFTAKTKTADAPTSSGTSAVFFMTKQRQHRTIPALRLKHRSGSCGTASALPKCSIKSGCGTRIVLRGQKPLALCDRCPCFGSLFPPLAALTFAASSIICAFGLASAAPRSPYRHLELCGIALSVTQHPHRKPGRCGKPCKHRPWKRPRTESAWPERAHRYQWYQYRGWPHIWR